MSRNRRRQAPGAVRTNPPAAGEELEDLEQPAAAAAPLRRVIPAIPVLPLYKGLGKVLGLLDCPTCRSAGAPAAAVCDATVYDLPDEPGAMLAKCAAGHENKLGLYWRDKLKPAE